MEREGYVPDDYFHFFAIRQTTTVGKLFISDKEIFYWIAELA